ncbi:MAG TPA: RsmB/NOP family class I SAM-dependent RNA methyltransferase [Chthonomonadaceae bacterium]|nr:RsmB/NOP family class I SAM-dependent RNA methyltransferase [Chthonomonadaceae bacterium]
MSAPSISAAGERRALSTPRAISAAGEILARWLSETERGGLDRLVQAETRRRRELNSSERRWLVEALFGTVRYLRRQEWILQRRGVEPGAAELIALWAELGGPAAGAGLPGPESPGDYLRLTLAFSDAMAAELEALLGAEAVVAAEHLNGPAPPILRVNTLRASRGRVLRALEGARRTRFCPWGVELSGRADVHQMPGFRDGWYEVQEEASQIVALLTDARPGQTIVDVGAGAGGKSLAIAAMMGGEGALLAVDSSRERLNRLEERAARGHVRNIRPVFIEADSAGRWQPSATKRRTLGRLEGTVDCVLVDAPCSGSGIVRRAPDLKWRGGDPVEHARLQSLLLEQAAALPAPGGALIYATCAIEREQNEAVVERFLASAEGAVFTLERALPRLRRAMERAALPREPGAIPPSHNELESLEAGPYLRTWPHRHGMDAFFAASLVRT